MTHTILIYDFDVKYAMKLAEYINTRKNYPFEARFAIDEADLADAFNRLNIDLLLCCEVTLDEAMRHIHKDKIIILSDDSYSYREGAYTIFKYQCCDNIIKEILKKASQLDDIGPLVHRKNTMKLYGVFDRSSYSKDSWLAYEIAKDISKKGKTILICANGFVSSDYLTGAVFESDLAELLYEICVLNRETMAVIGGNIHEDNGLALLPPVRNYRDLISITSKEWRQFLDKIESSTDYEYLIFDIGEGIQDFPGVIAYCDRIYLRDSQDEDNVCFEKISEILSFEGVTNAGDRIQKYEAGAKGR